MLSLTKIFDQASKIQIKSITDSLFKYSVIIFILGIGAAVFKIYFWIIIILIFCGCLLLLLGLIFYIYFSIKNPDYLRSESFQLKKQSIEILGDKDNTMNPYIGEIKYIASPYSEMNNDVTKIGG